MRNKMTWLVRGPGLLVLALSLMMAPLALATAGHIVGDGIADTPLEADALHHGSGVTDGDDTGQQHGGVGGHLPGSSLNVELVGQLTVSDATPGRIADVGVLGDFAYLAAFNDGTCRQAGVYIVDVSDPTNPTEVGFIPTPLGSFVGEGAQAIHLNTHSFRGDILVFNNEICALTGSQIGGVSIYDVTNPLAPVPLAIGVGDTNPGGAFSTANQIHSAFAWQQGKRAFVVIVDDEELEDVDILEITDPSAPVQIAEVGLADWPDAQNAQSDGIGSFAASFFHDVVVRKVKGRWLMLLSYWDAGYIVLNVDDPANPVFVNDTDFSDPDPLTGLSPAEGNAHEAEWSHNEKFILAADEDFSPTRISSFTSSAFAGSRPAAEATFTPLIINQPGGVMTGEVVHVGRGCPAGPAPGNPPVDDPYLANPAGKIALIERGLCRFDNKVARAQQAGAVGVIVYNSAAGGEGLISMGGDNPVAQGGPAVIGTVVTIPAVFVQRSTGLLLIGGTPPVTATAVGEFNAWGYVHLFDADTLQEIDTYAIAEALSPAFASGFGDLSVHEVATDPSHNLAYISYYAGGFRVVKFGPAGIEEVGHYVDANGNNFWGVQVLRRDDDDDDEETLILASDRDSGLWIFRYTGP
ncbi:MAG: PA domain-containing protein [Anaerolineales bacterium]